MSMNIREWTNKYNPFNSLKVLTNVDRWRELHETGNIPPPLFLSIDPSGICNKDCPYCNAAKTMQQNPHRLSVEDIDSIISLLEDWGVRAVCVGGGGEPLTNPNITYLLDLLHYIGIPVGVVTNGSLIPRYLRPLSLSKWVGISINAGTPDTYAVSMGSKPEDFEDVLENAQALKHYSKQNSIDLEVTYKYLIHPMNYKEIFEAARLAKKWGFNQIHFRPGDDPWFRKGNGEFTFTKEMIDISKGEIEAARLKFEDENFKVYGVMHKFNESWVGNKAFSRCYATLVQCLINSSAEIELCCDRRGDPSLVLCTVDEAKTVWGSDKHKEMVKNIQLSACPRCTYTHVNEVFENVVINDRMMYDFI